jgi:hypothetical protein
MGVSPDHLDHHGHHDGRHRRHAARCPHARVPCVMRKRSTQRRRWPVSRCSSSSMRLCAAHGPFGSGCGGRGRLRDARHSLGLALADVIQAVGGSPTEDPGASAVEPTIPCASHTLC